MSPTDPDEVAAYIADHYGTCARGSTGECLCLRPGMSWRGRGCPDWRPVADRTWGEMLERLRRSQK